MDSASGGGSTDPSGAGGDSLGTGGSEGGGGSDPMNGSGGGVSTCDQECPAPSGVEWQCKRRFMLGANWGWREYATDFGGLEAWGRLGVSEDPSSYSADMAQMKAAGSSVIRWWMWPRFLTDSIQWQNDAPSAIGGTLIADVLAALELAEQNDVYLMLTPFSFNNFEYSKDEGGVWSRSIVDMVTDPTKRSALFENLIRPVAQAVEASPYRHRMLAWDLINEPEWAVMGNNPYNREPFRPESGVDTVSPEVMKTFLDEFAAVLRQESSALLTIGSASIGWASAWKDSDVDFYQVHYYDWVYYDFPYNDPAYAPANMGLMGKPVVMGEYPYRGLLAGGGLPAKSHAEFLNELWSIGYAGALGWSYSDNGLGGFDGPTMKAFADAHACEASY